MVLSQLCVCSVLLMVLSLMMFMRHVLFLPTGGVVLSQLLDWVRQHATQFDKSAAAVTEAEIPEKHPDYWSSVSRRSPGRLVGM